MPVSQIRTLRDLGKLVQSVREQRRFTQQQLSNELRGIVRNRSAVAHLEQGLRLPDGDELEGICRYLGIPEAFWVGFKVRKLSGNEIRVACRCFTYYTAKARAESDDERNRNSFVGRVKDGRLLPDKGANLARDPNVVMAARLRSKFPDLFANRALVPVPGHSAGIPTSRWASHRMAQAIASASMGSTVHPLVERHTTIRKSADPKGLRPRPAEHLETLRLADPEELPPGIVLVDDVVTRGSTMLACAKLLRDAGWLGEINAIAAAYTQQTDKGDPGEMRLLVYSWDGGPSTYPRRTRAS
jgi:transcriptional regulator with XRE-family HTH domain